ncbi:MAG: phage portal protein [Janthinobacterium lividum]
MLKNLQNFFKSSRNDSWVNILTGLGTSDSRTNSTLYKNCASLNEYTLREIYNSNGVAINIVNAVVDDAICRFIESDKLLLKEMQRIDAKQSMLEAGYESRLLGGSMIVAFIDDGQDFEKPLNYNKINRLISLKVFNKHQVSWTDEDVCKDFYKEYYGKPEIFRINSEMNAIDSDSFLKVHRSRCFNFRGNKSSSNSQYWGNSVLQSCYEALRNYGIINSSAVEIVHDFVQVIMKINGLSDMIINGEERAVLQRVGVIEKTKSIANMVLLDGSDNSNESYEKRSSSVAGLPELWDKFSEAICAVSKIPKTRLFGSSPSGLNATGKSDLQNWYDVVRSYRSDQIEPCIDWLIEILRNQKEWKTKPLNYEWEFPSLTSPSELEWADIKKTYAAIDWGYIDRGAIDATDVWQERFGKGDFHFNFKLKRPEMIQELEIEEENKEAISPVNIT